MDSTQTIYFLLSTLISRLPQFIVIVVGIIFCFSKMAKSPKAGKVSLIGLGILLFSFFLGIGLNFVLAQLPLWYREYYQILGYINIASGFVLSIIWSVGLGLIIYAVWAGRDEK